MRLWIAVVALAMLAGCGAGQAEPRDATAIVSQKLSGSWLLQSFTPKTEPLAPLRGLLDAQLGAMILSFQGTQFTAKGPGLDVNGRFEILETGFDQFTGNLYTPAGGPYRVFGRFEGQALHFTSQTDPWLGNGTLTRVQ